MNVFITCFVPLIVGALIGYVTNAVAIKMLFRPLKPVRFLGVKVPFTPGVLPRERHKLADSIGAMVERQLLTPEILRERLLREDVRAGVNAAIARYTTRALESPLGGLLEGNRETASLLAPVFRDFLRSPGFNALLDSFLVSLLRYGENAKVTVGELLGGDRGGALEENLKSAVRETLASQAPHIGRYAASALDAAYPALTRRLVRFLMKKEVHRELEVQGRVFLGSAILKLSSLQRFFVSAGQYDITLSERMSEIIDDLIDQLDSLLSDASMRKRITAFAEEALRSLMAGDAGSSLETVSRLVSSLASGFFGMSLGDLIRTLGAGDAEALIPRIRGLLKPDGGAGFEEAAGRAVNRFLDLHRDTPLSAFLALDGRRKERLDAYIGERLLGMVSRRIEEFLSTINVRTLVSERVDSLDMIEVEHIVLDVMANQLKWINVFGAILGALMGGFQVLLALFTN
ncbi:MAG: DUF445 family protein [Spirochaetaceae bacterium]|jgi:uncharacterized membrane protein YheB (UPF0754 family)|nr:DUF445 family protein [Spirochaetaceae bacterium]